MRNCLVGVLAVVAIVSVPIARAHAAEAAPQAAANVAPAPLVALNNATDAPAQTSLTLPAAPEPDVATPRVDPRLIWHWPKFQPHQYALTLGAGALAVASVAIPGEPKWTKTNGFDDGVRDALRLVDPDEGTTASGISDTGLVMLVTHRLIDTVFITWWLHGQGSTALQMTLIDAQALAFATSIQSFVAGMVGRERPYMRELCTADTEDTDCDGSNRYRSFFSGHSTVAFTTAALTCSHHINVPIYGGGPVEAIPCVTSMLTATAVALLRVAADRHYFSDVLVGSAIGTAVGFGVPYAFHYAFPENPARTALARYGISDFSFMVTPLGVSAAGGF